MKYVEWSYFRLYKTAIKSAIYIFKYTFINAWLLAWSAHSNQFFTDSKQLQKFAILFYFIQKHEYQKKEKNSAVVKGNFGLGFNDRRQLWKIFVTLGTGIKRYKAR